MSPKISSIIYMLGELMKLGIKKYSETQGKAIFTFELSNDNNISVVLTNIGATIVSLTTPDRNGNLADVVLGYDKLEQYMQVDDNPYFGCTVGRYANRIAAGQFAIDDKTYNLDINNGPNALHGGVGGFSRKIFNAETKNEKDFASVTFSYTSPDSEDKYPSTMDIAISYTLNNENQLIIDYKATADAPTVCNLTNHSYWNLAGAGAGDVLAHELELNADQFTPFDENQIPTGELKSVENTPYDFLSSHAIGDLIAQTPGGENNGYDHNYVLNKASENDCVLAATVVEPESGRVMKVYTTEPGVQLYTANWLDHEAGKAGMIYHRWGGLCLECQHFPDSPNKPNFPTTLLLPGQTYTQKTIHEFSVK